ncbi:MAG: hypothetical protein JWP78_2655 [Mucilaginibacter sp.]|nr:hypothetical protein [Mucilaginibacter sp.]
MKTALTKFLAFGSIALLMLASCKKNDPIVKTNGGTAGALTANTTTPVLDKTKLADTTKIVTFTFTKPAYGYSAAVTNTLQIDSAGDNWKKPMSVTLGTKTLSQSYSTVDFNALLLKLNLTAGKPAQVQVRVEHSLGAGAAPVYSNVLSLTVTPFNLTSFVYVAGAYEGWANPGPQEDSLVSVTGNGIYVGVINFTAGNNQFLVLPAKNWNHKYATIDAQGTTSSTVSYDGPNNFYAPTAAGQYIVTFNINTNTISFALANTYSIIGDGAQGWNAGNDVAMKYINDGTSTWTVTTPLVSTGSIKIRQNDDWTYSWGIPKPGSAGDGVAGELNNTSNTNIPVASNATYSVSFSIPLTAIGTTPSVTAFYTIK